MVRGLKKCAVALAALCAATGTASAQTFSNPNPITIPAGSPVTTSGVADPYGSTISVAAVMGPVAKVTVTLTGLTHTNPDDIDVLLVSPSGTALRLMSDCGGAGDISSLNFTFDDFAASNLPDNTQLSGGTYRPTNFGVGNDGFPAPAPAPNAATLSAFNGQDPNGTWTLYVQDDTAGSVGSLDSWSITFLCGIEVTNTNNSGAGSLRAAVTAAEANPGLDVICFNIPGAGPHVISLTSELEMIDQPLIIDGLTQPGTSHNTWPPTLLIAISGAGAGMNGDGLEFNSAASGSMVRGLAILNFDRHGIILDGADNCQVKCCYVVGNGGDGVRIVNNADNNVIGVDGDGVDDDKERNLISGNGGPGVRISGQNCDDNRVSGNFIGTRSDGAAALANRGPGVFIDDSNGHLVGTDGDGVSDDLEGNLISGNGDNASEPDAGILIRNSSRCIIAGNLIGVAIDGVTALPNISDGVCLSGTTGNPSNANRIGTNADGVSDDLERNVISGNGGDGVGVGAFGGSNCQRNRIAGNFIGVGTDGVTAIGNGQEGVDFQGNMADNNYVGFDQTGADNPAKGNIIANNTRSGVVVRGSNAGNAAMGNWIRGNLIYNNGGLGIDLGDNGVTPNDDNDLDSGPNEYKNFPVITSVAGSMVSGTYNSVANKTYDVDVYQSQSPDPSGHGEGQYYLGSTTVTTDGMGNGAWSLNVVFRGGTLYISSTATDRDINRGTSEFSGNFAVAQVDCEHLSCEDINTINESGRCAASVSFGPLISEECLALGYIVTCTIGDGMGGQTPISSPHVFPIGATTVTCTLMAPTGLPLDECTFVVTVTNVEVPTIVCPDNFSVNTDQGECGANVSFQPRLVFPCDAGGRSLYTIRCTINGQPVTSPHFFPVGVTTVECCLYEGVPPAFGENGNPGGLIDCCTFTVTVTDAERPMLVCKQDSEVEAGACGTVYLTAADVVLVFTDNCPLDCCDPKLAADPSTCGLSFSPSVLECPLLDVPIPIAVTATDCHGNTSTCTATVIVRGPDCNNNGRHDYCDICMGVSLDCNQNWIPDECECFWCNVQERFMVGPPPQPDVNAQLSHLGGGTACGEKVADDFYLEPGCMHRITAVRGRLLTNSLAPLRRARIELYEDCSGKPVDQPFFTADYTQPNSVASQVIDVHPAADGFSVVTYRFDLCDKCVWLEGGKTYWVSLIGLPDHIDNTDLSYWVAGPTGQPLLGSVPVKRSGTPGSTWGSCNFGPWQSLDTCCIGCVNMDFCVDGYSCPIIWDNGGVDLVNKGGSASGTHQQYSDRTADSFVIKTCKDEDLCLIEAWIWTNCDPVYGFIELYADLPCGPPQLANESFREYSGNRIEATRYPQTWTQGGRTYTLWRLQVKNPAITLIGGRNYWLSAGAYSTGNFNANSFFAWSTPGCDACTGVNTFRITPAQHRTLRPPPTPWADASPRRDCAFRIAAKAPDAIPTDTTLPPDYGAQPGCLADANNDGTVAVDDIFTFLSAWFTGCP